MLAEYVCGIKVSNRAFTVGISHSLMLLHVPYSSGDKLIELKVDLLCGIVLAEYGGGHKLTYWVVELTQEKAGATLLYVQYF